MASTGLPGHEDATFGAFVALAPAVAARREGALSGLRVAVKDNIGVAGLPFTAGLPMFRERVAERDAEAVTRLLEAGATIAGVTRTDSAGLGVATPEVTNPRFPRLIAGGSSGGSAAAVAAGLAELGLGTDTGGSVRIPAACCRIFGFKPSHGRVPATGVWPLASALEDVGLMAADIATLAAGARVLLGNALVDKPRERPLRIGMDLERVGTCAPEVALSFERSLARLEKGGCEVRDVRLPSRIAVSRAHSVLVLVAALALYREAWAKADVEGLGATVSRALEAAEGLGRGEIDDAHLLREDLMESWNGVLERVDCVATPTLAVPVPLRDVRRVRMGHEDLPLALALTSETCMANLFGSPAVAIPPAQENESLQLIAASGHDEALLRDAAWIVAMLGGR